MNLTQAPLSEMIQAFTVVGAVLPGYLCLQGRSNLGDRRRVEVVAVSEIRVRGVWAQGKSPALVGIPGPCFSLRSQLMAGPY